MRSKFVARPGYKNSIRLSFAQVTDLSQSNSLDLRIGGDDAFRLVRNKENFWALSIFRRYTSIRRIALLGYYLAAITLFLSLLLVCIVEFKHSPFFMSSAFAPEITFFFNIIENYIPFKMEEANIGPYELVGYKFAYTLPKWWMATPGFLIACLLWTRVNKYVSKKLSRAALENKDLYDVLDSWSYEIEESALDK